MLRQSGLPVSNMATIHTTATGLKAMSHTILGREDPPVSANTIANRMNAAMAIESRGRRFFLGWAGRADRGEWLIGTS